MGIGVFKLCDENFEFEDSMSESLCGARGLNPSQGLNRAGSVKGGSARTEVQAPLQGGSRST